MKKNLFLSIIIPTYNSEATLQKCIDSITKQTFTDYEVLIIDGISNDNTLAIAKKYNDPRISIFSELDNGIYDAMNKGIDLAKGDWLYFLGSDDSLYETTTLEKISKLEALKNYDVVYGNVKIIGNTGWANDGDIYDGKFNIEKILNQNISHQAIFYNTKFVKDKIGYFNLKYVKSSDWDFNLRCWGKTTLYYDNNIFANFVVGGFSTNTTDHAIVDDFVSNVLRYFNINLFHPLINTPNFVFYAKVKVMQEMEYPYRSKMNRLIRKIIKRLKIK